MHKMYLLPYEKHLPDSLKNVFHCTEDMKWLQYVLRRYPELKVVYNVKGGKHDNCIFVNWVGL